MESFVNKAISETQLPPTADKPKGWKRCQLLFYWLAGARWSTLAHLPENERERIAIIGSSVLIPTLLAFFGMYLFASSRFNTPRPVSCFILAVCWALIIMNIDRILLATYRPFQPWFRKFIQIIFRIGLAGVISIAITFPFCLDQYRGAIKERLKNDYMERLQHLETNKQSEFIEFKKHYDNSIKSLQTELERENVAGAIDPQLYADEQILLYLNKKAEKVRTQNLQTQKELQVVSNDLKEIISEVRQLKQDLRDEENGVLDKERGGTNKTGRGPKYEEIFRNLESAILSEQHKRDQYRQLLNEASKLSSDGNEKKSASISDTQRAAFIREGQHRKEKIDDIKTAMKKVEEDYMKNLSDHESRYSSSIERYKEKMNGNFDLMEETIGLFKVIFIPERHSDNGDPILDKYKWIAALFQFSIVFGTLFLLDLIAILSKVMSRPGPYDVYLEFSEFVSQQNIIAFKKEYPRFADNWAESSSSYNANGADVEINDSKKVNSLLMNAHLPTAVRERIKASPYTTFENTPSKNHEVDPEAA